MFKKSSPKQKALIKLIVIYAVTVVAILSIVSIIVMFVLGYRFDRVNGQIEQYSFLQFSSSPSGATVTVDGNLVSSQTPNKLSVPAGSHDVVMWRDGYETWTKKVDAKLATMTWLNYALLVPKELKVEAVANYDAVSSSLASPNGHSMLIQGKGDVPSFDLVDLSSDTIKSSKLTIQAKAYSEPSTVGVVHSFKVVKWDAGGRYVLIKHNYGDKEEWLVMDTQDALLTKNITQLFNIAISDIYFSGTNGNNFYVLSSNDIRKLDLSAGTISRPFVGSVTSFSVYDSNIITYIGNGAVGTSEQVAGLYREGDEISHVLRTVANKDISLKIAATHYFNEDYVVISEDKKIDILSGSYPITANDNATSLKVVGSFDSKQDIANLTFSPTGEYVFVQSGAYFASYDLEYQKLAESTIEGTGDVPTLEWLDNNYIWSDRDGKLTIREFDGANLHTINSVISGQSATMTHNKRFIYSINKSDAGYQLQRVRMILP